MKPRGPGGLGQREASESASGEGGASGEGEATWQGSGPQVLEALPEEPEHDAQPRLPEWRERTAARPDGGGTPGGTRPSAKTEHVKRLRTDKTAGLREVSPERRNGRDDAGEQGARQEL